MRVLPLALAVSLSGCAPLLHSPTAPPVAPHAPGVSVAASGELSAGPTGRVEATLAPVAGFGISLAGTLTGDPTLGESEPATRRTHAARGLEVAAAAAVPLSRNSAPLRLELGLGAGRQRVLASGSSGEPLFSGITRFSVEGTVDRLDAHVGVSGVTRSPSRPWGGDASSVALLVRASALEGRDVVTVGSGRDRDDAGGVYLGLVLRADYAYGPLSLETTLGTGDMISGTYRDDYSVPPVHAGLGLRYRF